MTSTTYLNPNGNRSVAIGSYTNIDEYPSDDGNYNTFNDADDNKINHYYCANPPSNFYMSYRFRAIMNFDRSDSGTVSTLYSYYGGTSLQSVATGVSGTAYTAYDYTVLGLRSGYYWETKVKCGTVGKNKYWREHWSTMELQYYTKAEGAPTFVINSWNTHYGLQVTANRTLTGFTQTVYLERSYNGGAWSAVANGSNTTNHTTSSMSNGDTVRYRAYCHAVGSYSTAGDSDYTYTSTYTCTQPSATSFTTTTQTVTSSPQTIAWNASGITTPYYYLEVSFNGGGYSQIYANTSTSYNHALSSGYGTYTYRVRLNSLGNTNNYSNYSSTITITYEASVDYLNVHGQEMKEIHGQEALKIHGCG